MTSFDDALDFDDRLDVFCDKAFQNGAKAMQIKIAGWLFNTAHYVTLAEIVLQMELPATPSERQQAGVGPQSEDTK